MTNKELDLIDDFLNNATDCLSVDPEKAESLLRFDETAITDPFIFNHEDQLDKE